MSGDHIPDTGTKVPSSSALAADIIIDVVDYLAPERDNTKFVAVPRVTMSAIVGARSSIQRLVAPLYTRIEELEAEIERLKNTDD
jgi:hypothetical protein